MKIVYNNIFPARGYIAMTIWPWVFVRRKDKYTDVVDNHEKIHGEQQKEMLLVFFYLLYVVEYIIRSLMCFDHKTAYRSISFECEARINQSDMAYVYNRKHYAWAKYLFTKNKKI